MKPELKESAAALVAEIREQLAARDERIHSLERRVAQLEALLVTPSADQHIEERWQ